MVSSGKINSNVRYTEKNEEAINMKNLTYPMHVAGLVRDLPLCRVNDNLYIGAFVIFGDVELTVNCARELLKKAPEYDVLITAESKGIPLGYEMARQSGVNRYLIARKSPKLYMKNVFSVNVRSITTDRQQILCIDQDDADYMKGKRVLIVDDVISTGESLKAVEALVNRAGGNIVGRMAILAEGTAATRNDIIYLEKLPLFTPEGTPL
jgi:adenine phosphoribosyltransferase